MRENIPWQPVKRQRKSSVDSGIRRFQNQPKRITRHDHQHRIALAASAAHFRSAWRSRRRLRQDKMGKDDA